MADWLRSAIACCMLLASSGSHAEPRPTGSVYLAELMTARGLEATSVVMDVKTGAVVVRAASQPAWLDASTPVLPLSLAKLLVAAAWWDHALPDGERAHELLVEGRDSLGRTLAATLRHAVGTHAVIADLERYGLAENVSALAGLDDSAWSDCLSLGERELSTNALKVARFLQAVGNGGNSTAPPARLILSRGTALRLMTALRDTVQRGSASRISGALDGTGWTLGGRTGTGGRAGSPLDKQDGWFAGLIFDTSGTARFAVATFVRRGGLGAGDAAELSAAIARYLAGAR